MSHFLYFYPDVYPELCVDLCNRPASLYNAFLDKILSSKICFKKFPHTKKKEGSRIELCSHDGLQILAGGTPHMRPVHISQPWCAAYGSGCEGDLTKQSLQGKKRQDTGTHRAFCSFPQEHTDKIKTENTVTPKLLK